MGWFGNKKEEDIPELPDLHSTDLDLPALPSSIGIEFPPGLQGVEENPLPPLPNPEVGDDFSQSAIKHAIEYPDKDFRPSISKLPITPYYSRVDEEPVRRTRKIEPIYVRLDKFETTVEAFEEIRNKVMEIEKLLGKIKDIKSQEEKELEEWGQELQSIKARIEHIDKTVFNKLD